MGYSKVCCHEALPCFLSCLLSTTNLEPTQEDKKRKTCQRQVGAAWDEWIMPGLASSVHLLQVPLEEQVAWHFSGLRCAATDPAKLQVSPFHCSAMLPCRRDLLTYILLPRDSFWHPKGVGAAGWWTSTIPNVLFFSPWGRLQSLETPVRSVVLHTQFVLGAELWVPIIERRHWIACFREAIWTPHWFFQTFLGLIGMKPINFSRLWMISYIHKTCKIML